MFHTLLLVSGNMHALMQLLMAEILNLESSSIFRDLAFLQLLSVE